MTKVICVTGMHRSGTSLTASWIQKCGLQIDNGNLIGAAVGNELGHFEDREFVDLHSKYILRIWPKSKNWIILRSHRFSDRIRREFLNEARDLVTDRNAKYAFWGWKDPRTVIFLDMWKELIPDLKCLFVWRRGEDVVDSLIRRSQNATHPAYKIAKSRSFILWKYYNATILEYLKCHRDESLLVPITDLVANDKAFFDIIKSKFDLNLTYYEIGKLLQEDLLRQPKSNFYINLLSKFWNVNSMHQKLSQYSERIIES